MANLGNITDISVFKFYNGTLDQFKNFYNNLTAANKERVDNIITFIHEKNGTTTDIESGWLYTNKCYYTLSRVSELSEDDVTNIVSEYLETT